MIKFPSIEQFRNVVREIRTAHDFKGLDSENKPIYNHTSPYPRIAFSGTVKLHGTNAGIVRYSDGRTVFQSRERELSLLQDNSQFKLNMSQHNLDFLFDGIDFKSHVAIFGEWCGQGIQKGVAISELPKMFVIFACNVDGEWVDINSLTTDPSKSIRSVWEFNLYGKEIDFNTPEESQNALIEFTNEVESECPVGKFFGVSGIGEGIVWTAKYNGKFYQFKVKGEKHSVSKVKTLASVDVELVASMNEFAENTITEQRLSQGISYLKENGHSVDQTSTGTYLKWVIGDVMKEEQDTIVANQLDPKKLGGILSNKARVWFFNYINNND